MNKFKFEKSMDSNVVRTIRFPEELDKVIGDIVKEANNGKNKRKYSYNGFVVSACEYAIKNMEK